MGGFITDVLTMREITTPTAIPDYGRVYPKDDNQLYFQDGAGVEHLITLGTSDYGEMGNIMGSSAPEVLGSADEWHAMYHANINASAPHLNSGFTFVTGKAGIIASIADAGDGDVTVTDVDHGLLVGDFITNNGCANPNYNGVFEVLTVPTTATFTITATWGATDTGTWQMGSYLLVGTASYYRGNWHASFSQSLNNTQTSIVCPFVNTTMSSKACSSRLLVNNTDVGNLGGGGLMSFSPGDRIWFAAQTTAAQTLTILARNMAIR